VPRRLIGRFRHSDITVRLDMTDGDHVDFRVDSSLWDVGGVNRHRFNSRCQVRTVDRIVTLLNSIRMDNDQVRSGVVVRVRYGTVASAVLLAVAVIGIVTLGLTARWPGPSSF
jgi:hypothetical protein